jgi:type 1 glutamine amidotransferase
MRRFLVSLAVCLAFAPGLIAGEKTRVLLIGKDRDHPYGTHEYMTECALLAKCLRQTSGVDTVVSNGWPRDAEMLKDVKAIVLYTRNGGDVLLDPLVRKQAETILGKGTGLTAIHWSTGATPKYGEDYMPILGAWFSTTFSKLATTRTKLLQVDPDHPICRGWKEFDLRDEYYLNLKFRPDIKPVLKVVIDKKEHTVGWTYERPGNKGRTFGFVCGHFHDNFGDKDFRRAIVNGILWTARLEVPAAGAPCDITAKDMVLPPDERKKK